MSKCRALSIFFLFYLLGCTKADKAHYSLFGLESTQDVDEELVTLISKCKKKLNIILEDIDSFMWMQMCLVDCIFTEGGYYVPAEHSLRMDKIEERFELAYPDQPETVKQRMKEIEYCLSKSKDFVTTVARTGEGGLLICDGSLYGIMSCAVSEHIRLERDNGDLLKSILKLNQKLNDIKLSLSDGDGGGGDGDKVDGGGDLKN